MTDRLPGPRDIDAAIWLMQQMGAEVGEAVTLNEAVTWQARGAGKGLRGTVISSRIAPIGKWTPPRKLGRYVYVNKLKKALETTDRVEVVGPETYALKW